MGFSGGSDGKESACQYREPRFDLWVRKTLWRRKWQSSILAWRIPRTEEPGGILSMGLQRVGHDWATNTHTHKSSLAMPPKQKKMPQYSPRSGEQRSLTAWFFNQSGSFVIAFILRGCVSVIDCLSSWVQIPFSPGFAGRKACECEQMMCITVYYCYLFV